MSCGSGRRQAAKDFGLPTSLYSAASRLLQVRGLFLTALEAELHKDAVDGGDDDFSSNTNEVRPAMPLRQQQQVHDEVSLDDL